MMFIEAETVLTNHRQLYDVVVIGGGAVGLTLSVALAQAGLSTCLVRAHTQAQTGRTVALLDGSVHFLDDLDLWPSLAHLAAPLKTMRLVDATGSLFRPPPVSFHAGEVGLGAFGFNIENKDLEAGISTAAHRTPNLSLLTGFATDFTFNADEVVVTVGGQAPIRARLVVGADGRHSRARKAARIAVHTQEHPQVALTAIFAHEAPHDGISTEFHTRQGPFTLVPLPGVLDQPYRSSLVWVMSPSEAERRRALTPTAFAGEAERQSVRLLGSMTLISAIGAFPIVTSVSTRFVANRLVLAGEAAHALPPIGAQGLNLSLRDVAALVSHLTLARSRQEDIGSAAVLDRYARTRYGDVTARVAGVSILNGALLSNTIGTDFLRAGGLTALHAFGPLRRLAMRRGLVSQGRVTRRSKNPKLDATEEDRPSSTPL
jgi:2-octaprenyl-6-methoxyphenol hydroxylase